MTPRLVCGFCGHKHTANRSVKSADLQVKIGAPGFEPGTSPTRIAHATMHLPSVFPAKAELCVIGQVIAEAQISRSISSDWAHKSAVCPIGSGPDHWSQWMKLSYGDSPKISSSSDFTSGPIDPGP